MALYGSNPFADLNPFSDEYKEKLGELWSSLKLVEEINEALEERLQEFQRDYSGGDADQQLTNVVIKGNFAAGNNTWRYTLHRITYTGIGVYDTDPEVLTTDAVNVRELKHTPNIAWGVDKSLMSYPSPGFAPKPVGGSGEGQGHTHDVPTVAWRQVIDDVEVWMFSEMGSHDGECPAPP